jgi:hypothetical protein
VPVPLLNVCRRLFPTQVQKRLTCYETDKASIHDESDSYEIRPDLINEIGIKRSSITILISEFLFGVSIDIKLYSFYVEPLLIMSIEDPITTLPQYLLF